MKRTLLLITFALLSSAWTVDIDIGDGQIHDTPIHNLHIHANRDAKHRWHINGTTDQFTAILALFKLQPNTLKGHITPNLTLTPTAHGWQIDGTLTIENGSWHSPDGLQAMENIHANLRLHAKQIEGNWQAHIDGEFTHGEALIAPLYLNLNETPLYFSSDIQQTPQGIHIKNLRARSKGLIAHAELNYDSNNHRISDITLHQLSGDAQTLYQTYLKPYLSDTILDNATLSGTFFISGYWQPSKRLSQLNAVLNHITISDNNNRFTLNDIDGQLGENQLSTLRIGSSLWRKIPFGPTTLNLNYQDNHIQLAKPANIPILDGTLSISKLAPQNDHSYQFAATLTPINLEALSKALELPDFQGQISGHFPNITINQDGLNLNEPIYLNIFNGNIAIHDLRIRQLFTTVPVINFSANISKIDLGRLTHAFHIAEIQGNLTGMIQNATLINWQPQQFTAELYTDPNTPGKRRISHEAVQYLTKAGGSSATIGQFVRLFNAFPYEKLGIKASLQGDILTLDGVETYKQEGYYLVKGQGLPRLNIVGFQHKTSYKDLINRLKEAANSEGPIIQ